MFSEAKSFPTGHLVEHDLAIIGAGPAGLTLARQLTSKSNWSIGVFEGGGEQYEQESQELYDGKVVGDAFSKDDNYLLETRLRFLGGTSNHWHGWCLPLDEMDFQKRDWVPYSGWPISRSALDTYYEEAQKILSVRNWSYPLSKILHGGRPEILEQSKHIFTRMFHRSLPTRFATDFRQELESAQNLKTYLHANVVNIRTERTGNAVSELELKTPGGNTWKAKARYYVLATGGIENPRILLLSRDHHPQGLGNEHDLVGRFFLEHIQLKLCANVLFSGSPGKIGLYERFYEPSLKHNVVGVHALSAPALRQNKLLNCALFYEKGKRKRPEMFRKLQSLAPILDQPEKSLSPDGPQRKPHVQMECRTEQSPNPESRVTLLREKDALGMHRVALDWKLQARDRANALGSFEVLAREYGRLSEGRLKVTLAEREAWDPRLTAGGAHHMGTTRMASSGKKGVVDGNCRVHGIENLFIAGSSVFPTAGYANPTLTIVALVLRLADHLQGL